MRLLLLQLGLGLLGTAGVVSLAFNPAYAIARFVISPAVAIGAAMGIAAVARAWDNRGWSLARTLVVAVTFAVVLSLNPGKYLHAVAQDLWGLSDGSIGAVSLGH